MFFPLHDQNNEQVRIFPIVSYSIIGLNVLVFSYQYLLEQGGTAFLDSFLLTWSLVPRQVLENPWMVVSYQFLHANFMHIFGNLWFFWIFSDNVEEKMGSILFLCSYLLAGAIGGVLHLLLSPSLLIGASGAVAGVMGLYIMMFPQNRITSYFCPIWLFIRRIDVPAWVVLGFYLLFQTFAFWKSDILHSRIAFGCHLGGFVTGIVIGFAFRPKTLSLHGATASG